MDAESAPLKTDEGPVCSVCISNFNGGSVLEVCLDSVFQQDFSQPVEVIVHDDASTDGSADIVAEKFPDVRLIRSETNAGFCVSNNRMVAAAKGRYVLLLNNDAALHRDALSTLYNCATGAIINGIMSLPQYNMQTGELIDIGSLFDPFLNPIHNQDKSRRSVGMVSGACMWLPRKLWDELGGFPEWFESIAEDMYLCCIARLNGYPVIALSESGFVHWVGKSLGGGKIIQNTLQTTYRRRALSERNKSYVMLMCYPAPLAYLLIPLHLLLLTIEGFLLSVVKGDRRIWKDIYQSCFRDLWRNRRKLLQCRQEIQVRRQISSGSFNSVISVVPHKLRMLLKYGFPTVK